VAEVPLEHVIPPLAVVGLVALLATIALGVVIGDRTRAALIVTPVVLGLLLYGHVVELVDAPALVHRVGWLGLVAIGAIAAWRLGRSRLVSIDRALLGLAAVLLAFPLIEIVPAQAQLVMAGPGPTAQFEPTQTETDAPLRDVYWMVFDRYPSERAIELEFGIRNPLTRWLREQGFTVLDDSHANYVATSLSLATTANMAHLEDVTGETDSGSVFRRRLFASLQGSRVADQFKALGYRYVHIGSWWEPTRVDAVADLNLNASGLSDFSSELYDHSALPVVARALRVEEAAFSKQYQHGRYGFEALERVSRETGPKFVHSHILLPHPPYVFDRDGSFIAARELRRLGDAEAWQRQLEYTNERIKDVLEPLLALPAEERPIVILQADEGHWFDRDVPSAEGYSWAAATPEQLEIKFGILNAWLVPEDADLELDPALTAINTFPVLFNRYFGLDYGLLPERITPDTWSPNGFDLTDVRDRLPSLITD
jgi:hypothetical protein